MFVSLHGHLRILGALLHQTASSIQASESLRQAARGQRFHRWLEICRDLSGLHHPWSTPTLCSPSHNALLIINSFSVLTFPRYMQRTDTTTHHLRVDGSRANQTCTMGLPFAWPKT